MVPSLLLSIFILLGTIPNVASQTTQSPTQSPLAGCDECFPINNETECLSKRGCRWSRPVAFPNGRCDHDCSFPNETLCDNCTDCEWSGGILQACILRWAFEMDICFVIDDSQSITREEWRVIRELFIFGLVEAVTPPTCDVANPTSICPNVGIVQYNTQTFITLPANLSSYPSGQYVTTGQKSVCFGPNTTLLPVPVNFKEVVDGMLLGTDRGEPGGGTFTLEGVARCVDLLLNTMDVYPDRLSLLVLETDGDPNGPACPGGIICVCDFPSFTATDKWFFNEEECATQWWPGGSSNPARQRIVQPNQLKILLNNIKTFSILYKFGADALSTASVVLCLTNINDPKNQLSLIKSENLDGFRTDEASRRAIFQSIIDITNQLCEFRTAAPTRQPTTTPTTSSPSAYPTRVPTTTPTRNPTRNPTKNPTTFPTRNPTKNPTELPTANPTQNPTKNPTKSPTTDPTKNPTANPTKNPTSNPTGNPTKNPTRNPTSNPTRNPTKNPTQNPTANPTKNPTQNPTKEPTANPTRNPSKNPTKNPTSNPTRNPTQNPTKNPTNNPTQNPTKNPTSNPTRNPTSNPTQNPTKNPTRNPTSNPTKNPTRNPTNNPTKNPTKNPTQNPTSNPTKNPTRNPTQNPTSNPTANPTKNPTKNPTQNPTQNPTANPTKNPTRNPSRNPTQNPTANPTKNPTKNPTRNPTKNPTSNPTNNPTANPTANPTKNPTRNPTQNPTRNPTSNPTKNPTAMPTQSPVCPIPPPRTSDTSCEELCPFEDSIWNISLVECDVKTINGIQWTFFNYSANTIYKPPNGTCPKRPIGHWSIQLDECCGKNFLQQARAFGQLELFLNGKQCFEKCIINSNSSGDWILINEEQTPYDPFSQLTIAIRGNISKIGGGNGCVKPSGAFSTCACTPLEIPNICNYLTPLPTQFPTPSRSPTVYTGCPNPPQFLPSNMCPNECRFNDSVWNISFVSRTESRITGEWRTTFKYSASALLKSPSGTCPDYGIYAWFIRFESCCGSGFLQNAIGNGTVILYLNEEFTPCRMPQYCRIFSDANGDYVKIHDAVHKGHSPSTLRISIKGRIPATRGGNACVKGGFNLCSCTSLPTPYTCDIPR